MTTKDILGLLLVGGGLAAMWGVFMPQRISGSAWFRFLVGGIIAIGAFALAKGLL